LNMQRRLHRERFGAKGFTPGRLWTGIALALLVVLILAGSSTSVYAYDYYQQQLPQVQSLANKNISQTSHIYDRNMTLLYDAYDTNGAGRRTPISYNDIPQVMQTAQIAIEDRTFWTNSGVDYQGIVRNIPGYLSHNITGGGSTLTQQLVKNLRNNASENINRKISEAALAIGLTQQYPKTKILEMYMNVSPYGAQDLGVEAAAQDYFHLKPICTQNFKCTPAISQLDYNQATHKHDPILALARASLLAGMPQNPPLNDPTRGASNLKRALDRQQQVLDAMVKYHFGLTLSGPPITQAQAQQAEAMTAKMKFSYFSHAKRDPHFVDWVESELEVSLGNGNPEAGVVAFLNGGYNIRTTIDANLEQFVENAVHRHLDQPEWQQFPTQHLATLSQDNNLNDAAVVVMNTHDGEILAMDGSANYNDTNPLVGGSYNAADPLTEGIGTGRPVGSTFKPIVYATAFQMGWYPGMVLPDVKTYFPDGAGAGTPANPHDAYQPNDYNNQFSNRITTVREALADSYNVPAVKTLQFVGMDNALNNAHLMGVTTLNSILTTCRKKNPNATPRNCGLGDATVLGSSNDTVLQMTGAYQTFANQGVHVPHQGVLDIWDNYGHNLFHFNPNQVQGTRVFSPQVSYMMNSVLGDEGARYPEFLTDHDLSFWDWPGNGCTQTTAPNATFDGCQLHQVAAKTGTSDKFKDNWTIGYTPNIAVGVWAGNANDAAMTNGPVGVTGAGPIWHSVMEFASGLACVGGQDASGVPCPRQPSRKELGIGTNDLFPSPPPGIVLASTSSTNGLAPTGNAGMQDWMWAGQEPTIAGLTPVTTPPNGGGKGGNGGNGGNGGH
jgi:membrane peptidoglycan carboxypeptidase